ncbi:hypothetical protein J7E29_09735 [Streptomyces sp. ISL-90]|nr:hypothetical protein [Streptomyces sp. ISL-90]
MPVAPLAVAASLILAGCTGPPPIDPIAPESRLVDLLVTKEDFSARFPDGSIALLTEPREVPLESVDFRYTALGFYSPDAVGEECAAASAKFDELNLGTTEIASVDAIIAATGEQLAVELIRFDSDVTAAAVVEHVRDTLDACLPDASRYPELGYLIEYPTEVKGSVAFSDDYSTPPTIKILRAEHDILIVTSGQVSPEPLSEAMQLMLDALKER